MQALHKKNDETIRNFLKTHFRDTKTRVTRVACQDDQVPDYQFWGQPLV